jgi:hypothetical protein
MGRSILNIKILHQNCDPQLANDRGLPYNAYLVHYSIDDSLCYDIVIANKKVDIFDYYWDRYREGLMWYKQSEGRINPKFWDISPKEKKGKKRGE